MFFCHPLPISLVKAENPAMAEDNYFRPVQYPGFQPGKGISTTYGFNLVINAKASDDKRETLHDLYQFMMNDLLGAWRDAAPFTFAKKTGWADSPQVQIFPYVNEIIKAKDQGVFLPRTLVFNELADSMHRGVQKIMLTKADIKTTLDQVAAEVDRATAAYKKA
jgi:ABC-type glycerol-3-phosphate transport system substrate-binding protein